ncbi:hypothetical protein D3C77_368330 [compost metagenome]
MLIKPERALQDVLHARLVPDVIFADALQLPGGPAIDPAVANMGQGEAPTTQYQRTEGSQQRLATAVGP